MKVDEVTPDLLSAILDNAHDAIIAIDQNQNIVLFNQGGKRIFGYNDAAEVIGQPLDILLPLAASEVHRAHVHSFHSGTETARQMGERREISGRRKDGTNFPAEASIAKVTRGGATLSTVILRDITERTHAEEKRRRSEAAMNEAQKNAKVGSWQWDVLTNTVEGSDQFYEIIGVRKEDYGGTLEDFFQVVHPDDREHVRAVAEQASGEMRFSPLGYRVVTPDGTVKYVVANQASPVLDSTRMFGTVQDITERKLAEAALRQTEEQNRAILRAIPDLMFLQNKDGVYLDHHAKDPSLLLVPPEQFLGKKMEQVLPADLAAELGRCFKRALETNETQVHEYSLSVQGRRHWCEARITPYEGEKLLSVVRDITVSKQAEVALTESEERFAKAFKANPQPMSLTTLADGRYVDVNESFLATSGYRREEVIGRTSLELGIWETPATRAEFMQRLTEQGVIRNLETHFRTRGGSFRVLLSSAELVKIGSEQCVLVASSDITERKQAEETLRQSEERFRNMADTAPVLIWVSGEDMLCTYLNQRWLDFTGQRMEQALGNGWIEAVHQDDYECLRETYSSAFDRRESFRIEYRLRRADGVFRWVDDSGSPRFSSAGEFLGYIGSCSDITDRKVVEEAGRSAKDELRMIADALPVLISEVDKNGYYRFNNLACEHWFGQPSDQIIGHHMREVLGEAVWERVRPQVERALAGSEVHYEDFLSYRFGDPRRVSVTGIPIRDAEGEVNGFVSLVADITESRRAEETLRSLSGRLINAQEEERSRVARELHDGVSQRIAVLSIGLEQIGQQIPEGPDNLRARIRGFWAEAQEVSTELHRLSYQLHPQKLDHLGLVTATRSFCEELAAVHELRIEFRQLGFPASLSKDITLCLFRIVQESLHNAVKHSGAREAQVVLEKTDQAVRLSVSDTGCGFDTESSKMTSGLGFTSMRERLRLVGGQLSISSRPLQGTQIEITVPLKKQADRASSESSSTNPSQT
jgi:PAS domain S-box-containing protein